MERRLETRQSICAAMSPQIPKLRRDVLLASFERNGRAASRDGGPALRAAAECAGTAGGAGAVDFDDGTDVLAGDDGSAGVCFGGERDLAGVSAGDDVHAADCAVRGKVCAGVGIAGVAVYVCHFVAAADAGECDGVGAATGLCGDGRFGGGRVRALCECGDGGDVWGVAAGDSAGGVCWRRCC
jgi:hypothetical protein